jgi:hypothetical protein
MPASLDDLDEAIVELPGVEAPDGWTAAERLIIGFLAGLQIAYLIIH